MLTLFLILFFILQNFKCEISPSPNLDADASKSENALLVNTPVGKIRGIRADDGNYNMFLGIPYGKVNKSNPFGRSSPYPPFKTTFEANDDSIICPQLEEFSLAVLGSIDCLNLNIFVSNTANKKLLSVMVYIFGGIFMFGKANRQSLGPKYLIQHDIILVTFNHRVGPYGYMCLDTPEIPGNQGLKDQVLALRWIKNNIKSFGGDPDKVTIFGNSSGAMSVGLHLISEAEVLFKNAIIQSGSALTGHLIRESQPDLPIILAKAIGYDTNNQFQALEFLRNCSVDKVIRASNKFGKFTPCIEKKFPGVERFLARTAFNSNHSKVANMTILTGYIPEESKFIQVRIDPYLNSSWTQIFERNLRNVFNFSNKNQFSDVAKLVKRFYIGDNDVGLSVLKETIFFDSEFLFIYPTIRSIKYFLTADALKVYQYLFVYDGGRNYLKIAYNITSPGAVHADELGYIFKTSFIPDNNSIEDEVIIERLTKMWTNFAKYGDPTPTTTKLLPVKWVPVTKNSPYHYLIINSTMSMKQRYETQRMTFWEFFYEVYKKYERGYMESEESEEKQNDVSKNDSVQFVTILFATTSVMCLLSIIVKKMCS